MKLLQQIQNGLTPKVTSLTEGVDYSYIKYINLAYRSQRNIITESFKEFTPDDKLAKEAARQTRILLHMNNNVESADNPDVKALAIKDWNALYEIKLKELKLKEATIQSLIKSSVEEFVSEDNEPVVGSLKDDVIEKGKVITTRSYKPVAGSVRVCSLL